MIDQLDHIRQSLAHAGPELTLAGTFCAVILADLLARGGKAAALTGMLGVIVAAYLAADRTTGSADSAFTMMIAVDGFSRFFTLVILGTAFVIQLFSFNSSELRGVKRGTGEFHSLLIALVLGLTLMAGATNLLMMYLSLELSSIASYILAGYTRDEKDSSEASLKYVLYGAVASGMMLYGMSILYGLTGALDVYAINQALTSGGINVAALTISGVMIMVGFGYKISAVPFHFWAPDVYEGAPITITALLSVASKAAGFAMMIRFIKVSFIDTVMGGSGANAWTLLAGFPWDNLIGALSVLTMTVGNLIAIWQNNMKRLLAYSSVAHAGYMLLGVAAMSDEGVSAVLIYIAVYSFINLGAFYIVMLMANKTGSEDIGSYTGLGYTSPVLAASLTIFLIALTGLPPTAGFVGKLYIFGSLISARMVWLVVIGALNSVISLYYYIRVVRNMYLMDPSAGLPAIKLSAGEAVLLFALLLPTLFLGLYFGPLVEFAQASVSMFGIR